jgi:glutamate racemase
MGELDSTSFSEIPRDAPVAFIDSGVGGLPYLEWAKTYIPNETYVYLADRKNFPYGSKSPEEVSAAVSAGVAKLIAEVNPKMIVVACNTASVVALGMLRRDYPGIPFVGVVPAIKPAARKTRANKIGVLATARTVHDPYLDRLVEEFAPNCEVYRMAGPDIVEFVENRYFDSTREDRLAVIHEAAETFLRAGVDEIVLGCTHFLYVSEELREETGGTIEIVDSRDGVGRQIKKVLGPGAADGSKSKPDLMFLTGNWEPEEKYFRFAEKFGLRQAGTL